MDMADKQKPIGVNRRWGYLRPKAHSKPNLSVEELGRVNQLANTKGSFRELTSMGNMEKYLFHPKPSLAGIGIISNDTRAIVKSQKSQAQGLKEADTRPSKKAKTSRENTTPEDAHALRCLASFVAFGSKGLWKEKVPSQTKSAEAPSAAATPATSLDHVPMPEASKPLTARASKMGPAAQPEWTVPMGLEASASFGFDVLFIISRNGEVATEQPGAPHSVDRVPEGRGKGVAL